MFDLSPEMIALGATAILALCLFIFVILRSESARAKAVTELALMESRVRAGEQAAQDLEAARAEAEELGRQSAGLEADLRGVTARLEVRQPRQGCQN